MGAIIVQSLVGTGELHEKDKDAVAQGGQDQNRRHDGGRNEELLGFVPLKGREGKAESDGTEHGQNDFTDDGTSSPEEGVACDSSHSAVQCYQHQREDLDSRLQSDAKEGVRLVLPLLIFSLFN